jgi:uncharacterized membrane protein
MPVETVIILNDSSLIAGRTVFLNWVEAALALIEGIAIAIIVIAVLWGTFRFLGHIVRKNLTAEQRYTQYRHGLGRALLIGLEIMVVADIIRTVILEFTLSNMAILALLILLRTFLSWSLEVEMEGRWPWQSRNGSENA